MPTKKERLGILLTEEELAQLRALLEELQRRRWVSRRWTANCLALALVRRGVGFLERALRRGRKIAPLP